jgi:hypothetical protein
VTLSKRSVAGPAHVWKQSGCSFGHPSMDPEAGSAQAARPPMRVASISPTEFGLVDDM